MNFSTLIDAQTVAAILGVDRSTVWRKAAAGEIPKPCRIAGLTRWSRSEIDAAISAKMADRDGEAA